MTAVTPADSSEPEVATETASRRRFHRHPRDPDVPLPPLTPRAQLVRGVLVLIAIVSISLAVQLVILSGFQ